MRLRFCILILPVLAPLLLGAEIRLSGDTGFPERSMYIPGEPVEVTVRVSGLSAGEAPELIAEVRDWREQLLKTFRLPVRGDRKGCWSYVLRGLPNREWGFYRVYLKLSNGVILPKRGTRPAGFLTYAVVPDPDSRPVPPQGASVFGFHNSYISPWVGARSVMRTVLPTEEQYRKYWAGQRKALNDVYKGRNWLTYSHTAFVGAADPFGYWTPEQRGKYSKVVHPGIKARMFLGEEGERLYRESVKKIAASARFQMENNRYMNYQPMWEPNICFTPDEILLTHKAAFAALREADPEGRILGLTYANLNWDGAVLEHKRLFERGLLNYMDALSLHPYCVPPLSRDTFIARLRDLMKYVKQYSGGREIPVYATEFGIAPANNAEGDMIQLNHMIQQCLILLGEGVSVIQPFYAFDLANRENRKEWTFGITYNLSEPVRSYPKAIAPKMWLPAYSVLTFLLEGFHSNGMIPVPDRESAVVYRYGNRKNDCIVAAWDYAGESVLRLPVGRDEIEVADVMGKRKRVKCPGMVAEIPLSQTPVYLLDVSPELYGNSAVKKIRPDSGTVACVAGGTLSFSGGIQVSGDDAEPELCVTFPKKTGIPPVMKKLDGQSLAEQRYSMPVHLPKELGCGKYHVVLSLLSRGRTLASEWITVEITPPVRLEKAEYVREPGKTLLRFRLQNVRPVSSRGRFIARLGKLRRTFPLNVGAGKTQSYEFPLNGAENDYVFRGTTFRIDFELEDKNRFSERKGMNFLIARHLPGVGENGDFSGWEKPEYFPLPDTPVRSRQYHSGVLDLSAKAAFGWNRKFLLLDIVAEDDRFVQPFTGLKTWNGDSVQCGFAKNAIVPETANELEFLMAQAYSEIDYALTKKGPEAYRTISFDRSILPEGSVSSAEAPFRISKESLPDGRVRLRYRIALPWRFLNIAEPVPGQEVWTALAVNDRDDADLRKQKDVSAIGAFQLKHQAPRYFGSVRLEP